MSYSCGIDSETCMSSSAAMWLNDVFSVVVWTINEVYGSVLVGRINSVFVLFIVIVKKRIIDRLVL